MECAEITRFPEWDLTSSGGMVLTLGGWSKDGKRLRLGISFADFGPGEGEPPPAITPLDGCRKAFPQKDREPYDTTNDPDDGSDRNFALDASTPTSLRREDVGELFSDGAFAGSARSPDGKSEATIRDPYQGKSELVVDGKVLFAGIKVRRFWWVAADTIAAMSINDEKKSFELRVIHLPDRVFGPYFEARD